MWGIIEAGDGGNPLLLLEALADENVEDLPGLDDSIGLAVSVFGDLGTAWTEAGLAADGLTPKSGGNRRRSRRAGRPRSVTME